MKRHWKVRRQLDPRPDGAQRWDRVYQHLLQWANPTPPSMPESGLARSQSLQEVDHVSRPLCAGLDPEPSRKPDH